MVDQGHKDGFFFLLVRVDLFQEQTTRFPWVARINQTGVEWEGTPAMEVVVQTFAFSYEMNGKRWLWREREREKCGHGRSLGTDL